ncbi:heat shock factor binding protein 1-domain-containing protein [Aspergillus coremiiformis]|uniref:Heat shock factor binding protein 1-domain-containing protein n=1 Tax=Aspergillus coremiiformis TaxID=138285 RepID=A0A5N6Z5P7_9EURO|nr:heat shock factor binding protein 1-domain-containing protein [Aspergillus coremiiformis]
MLEMSEDDNKSVSTSEAVTPPTGEQALDAQDQLNAAIDELLDQLHHKFDNVSREMFGKLDDMARRLDELEASLTVPGDSGTGTGPASPTT